MKFSYKKIYSKILDIFFTAASIVLLFFLLIKLAYFLIDIGAERTSANIINTFTAYIATATDSEYDQLTQKLRNDFSINKWDARARRAVQCLPNTATKCRACQFDHPPQIYLLAVNTGNLYSLAREIPVEKGCQSISGGYDELSQTDVTIITDGGSPTTTAYLTQKHDVISVHKMKAIYCDDCIDKILSTIDGQTITSFVLFSASDETFSPISDGLQMQGEDYALNVNYDVNNNKMQIEFRFCPAPDQFST